MRCCGNCFWSFSPEDEDELRSEYHGEDYDMDANTPKAGDFVFFEWGEQKWNGNASPNGNQDHTGLVVSGAG